MYIYATTTTRVAWIKTFGTWTPLRLPKLPQEAPSSAFRGAHYLHYSPSQTALLPNNKFNKISSYVSLFLTPKHENCSKLCLLPAVLGNAGSKQEITVIVLTLSRSEPLPPFLLKSRTTSNIFAQKSNFTSNIWFNCYRSNANRQSARGKDLEPNKNTQIVYELIFLLLHIIIIFLTITSSSSYSPSAWRSLARSWSAVCS